MDIVEKLRQNAASGDSCQGVSEDMLEAARVIEQARSKYAEDIAELNKRLTKQHADMLDTIVELRASSPPKLS